MNTQPAISFEGIATTGVGRCAVTPDTLTLQLGSQITADSVQAALDRVAADSDTLLDLIEAMDVPRHRVQTGRIAVHPQWTYTEAGQQLSGYQVTIDHSVSVTSTESAAAIIAAAAEHLADRLIIGGLVWSVSESADALEEARALAWHDAVTRAQQLADLARRPLGHALWMREGETLGGPVPLMAHAELAAAPRLEPGQSELEVRVQVQFAFGESETGEPTS